MSSGSVYERLFKLEATINKMVLDRARDPEQVAEVLQKIINEPAPPAEPTEKFVLLGALGIFTVPDEYDHATRLTTFSEKYRQEFYYYNDAITDKTFPKPSRILKPGDKLHVRAFKQVVAGTTTSEERLAFLTTQKAIHTGAQGASLVWEQKRDQLPRGYWYDSFDEKGRLWEDADGNHRVPYVSADSGDDFGFDLGYFGCVWLGDCAFLGFCDEYSGT